MFEGDLRRCEMANRSMSAWKFTLRSDVYDLASIVAVSRMTKTRYPDLAAIFVDYAQLVRGERRKGDSREQEVAGVSRTLRLLGIELNAAVILLSQLNADGATRESTSLEKDTTAIWKLLAREDENERLFFIPRQRDGESNVGRPIAFFGAEARVENLADDPT
jgi:replicative DNA helicase